MARVLIALVVAIMSGVDARACISTAEHTNSLELRCGKTFLTDRTYYHDLFDSVEKCEEARRNYPFLNCSRWVELRADGTMLMIVTDIANFGTYEISGEQVMLKFQGAAEIEDVTFRIIDDQTLQLERDQTLWIRRD